MPVRNFTSRTVVPKRDAGDSGFMVLPPELRQRQQRQQWRLTESLPIPYIGGRADDIGFVRTQDKQMRVSSRDLPAFLHDKHIVNSFRAYRTNALGHRLINMPTSFILGNGISITARDPGVMATIMQWWSNPYNAWPRKCQQRIKDLLIYGEWIHRPVKVSNGNVFILDVKPDSIVGVEPDEYDHGEIDKLLLRGTYDSETGRVQESVPVSVIRYRIDMNSGQVSGPDGDLFYFGLNRTSDTGRGIGILFPVLDYLDIYDDILFSRAEKIKNMSHMFWDLLLSGMSADEMQRFVAADTNLPPEPGGVWAHNESALLTAVVPDMKTDNHVEDAKLIKSHVVASQGWPGTWVDDPGTAGRAVGTEMAEPALKYIQMLQSEVGNFLRFEIDYMLAHNKAYGGLKSNDPDSSTWDQYTISFNKPSARDFQRIGPALGRYTDFITKITNTLVTPDEARAMLTSLVNQLDLTDIPLQLELPTILKTQADEMRQAELDAMRQPAQPGAPGAPRPKPQQKALTPAKPAAPAN